MVHNIAQAKHIWAGCREVQHVLAAVRLRACLVRPSHGAQVVKEVVNPDATIVYKENTSDDPTRRKPDITKACSSASCLGSHRSLLTHCLHTAVLLCWRCAY